MAQITNCLLYYIVLRASNQIGNSRAIKLCKMSLKSRTILLILLSIIVFGCSPSEFFTLTPDAEKVDVEDGTEIAFFEDDFVYSNIEFEEEAMGNFVFYVFVYNKSDDKILIDPTQIKMIVFDENKKPLQGYNTFYAREPRLMIGKLEDDINGRRTEHDISTGLNFIFALVNTVSDLSNGNDNDAAEVFENVAVFTENQVHEEIDYSNDIEFLRSQKKMWENDVLPKIMLDAQDDIGGLVFIPECSEAAYIKIIIPFEKTKHTYFFKKEKIGVE